MPLTFGQSPTPSQFTEYLDALFAQTLANYSKTLIDNIALSNALLFKIINGSMYQPCDGGTYIAQPLMYALGNADSYDGYDELADGVVDGVTQALFEWRQCAAPISYSMKEMLLNRASATKIIDLVSTKVQQGELGLQEYWAQALLWGSGAGALATPKVSTVNGSSSIEPLAKLIHFTPSSSLDVGNINQSTYTWWRNNTKTAAATTYEAYLFEMDNMYNTCSRGTGGAPDLIMTDQVSYELYVHAYFQKYRKAADDVPNFPFEAKKFKNAIIAWDEKMHDVFSGVTNADTYGTMYFFNTKFMRCRYHPDRNFEMLKNDDGKTFAKPLKGDSRLGHMAWMGNMTINNRRKFGVYGKIPRTLT